MTDLLTFLPIQYLGNPPDTETHTRPFVYLFMFMVIGVTLYLSQISLSNCQTVCSMSFVIIGWSVALGSIGAGSDKTPKNQKESSEVIKTKFDRISLKCIAHYARSWCGFLLSSRQNNTSLAETQSKRHEEAAKIDHTVMKILFLPHTNLK